MGLTQIASRILKLVTGGGLSSSAAGLSVSGFQQVSGSPTLSQGIGWYDSSTGLYRINPVTVSGNSLPSSLNATFFSGTNSNTIVNTAALTAYNSTIIPAGYLNLAGRTIRGTVIVGAQSVSGTFVLTLQYAGATIWTSPTITGTQLSNLWVDLLITTTATGASGALLVLGRVFNASVPLTAANALTTVNLTVAAQWNLAGQWSIANAGNAAQLSFWAFELLG